MKNRYSRRLQQITSAIVLIGLSACSSDSSSPDDGGGGGGLIIGTGVTLEGTATSNKRFASTTVEVRSRTGERATGSFSNQGRFKLDAVTGSGPWLLRSDLGNDNYLYGVATDSSADAQVQNIHSYSDAVVRSWYTTQNLNVDTVFNSESTNAAMPTNVEANAIYNSLAGVVADVIANYDIAGVNLNSVEFAANGAGVDKFILQNPVIHNDGNITIIIFDPDNNTASVAVEDFDLATDLTDADATPPSAPTSLRALPSARDEITLVWKEASDNIGIARYTISRNGQPIATSPYPVFVDGGLTGGSTYNYSVTASDAAGNESTAALASAAPQVAMDTTAPQTPSSVRIDTRRGSLDIEWSLNDVSDVASFDISRGESSDAVSPYVSVNSNFLFDDAVNAGIEYCYKISAVDASGNISAPTGAVCATAPGAVVTNVSPTTAPPVTTTPIAGALTAPQLDVSDMACTTEVRDILGSIVREDVILNAGCYISARSITVAEPGSLTIEPGVVIKFGTVGRLEIQKGASLIAQGTATNPIVLTGRETEPGHWDGLTFLFSNSSKNVLDHVQIEYAGSQASAEGGLDIVGNSTSTSRVSVTNSTMRFNEGPGMSISNGISLSTFNGNRFTNNAAPVLADGASVELLDKRSLYTGNTRDAVVVEDSTLNADTTWPALTVPYQSDALDIDDGVFTVEGGTSILFEQEAYIQVSGGALAMLGTAEAPISLSALNGLKGGWEGLRMRFSDNDENQLRFVTVQHAGESSEQDAAISIRSTSTNTTRVAFDNVTITDSVGFGIGATDTALFTEFENVTITGNDALAKVGIKAAQAFNNVGNYTGNAIDVIELQNSTIEEGEGDVILSNSDIPYQSVGLRVEETLTLEAGVSLKMQFDALIRVDRTGTFITNGTASAPVSIVGLERTAGFWDGIVFVQSSRNLNRLTYTLLADGGGAGNSQSANMSLQCFSFSQVRLTIENSQIENSAGFGLYIPESNCVVDIDAGTTFTNNVLGDLN